MFQNSKNLISKIAYEWNNSPGMRTYRGLPNGMKWTVKISYAYVFCVMLFFSCMVGCGSDQFQEATKTTVDPVKFDLDNPTPATKVVKATWPEAKYKSAYSFKTEDRTYWIHVYEVELATGGKRELHYYPFRMGIAVLNIDEPEK